MRHDFDPIPRTSARSGRAVAERRQHNRRSFSASAEIVEVVSGARLRLNARVSDLSVGGCYLDTINPFALETKTHLRIRHRDANFTCVATVKSSTPGMGMGLAFEDVNQAHQDLLQSWLDDSAPIVPEHFTVEQTWKDVQPITSHRADAADAPKTAAAAVPQISNDAFALRLAKLLQMKGLLSDSEMASLLSDNDL